MGEPVRRVLVRGTNWIGDSVMSIPALREIRLLFPHAHITLMVRPWVSDVFKNARYIDEILIYEKNATAGRVHGYLKIIEEIKMREFEIAILLQNALEAALITFFAGIPIRVGYPTDGRSLFLTQKASYKKHLKNKHQIYYYLGILNTSGIVDRAYESDETFRPDISLSFDNRELDQAKQILRDNRIDLKRRIIGLNPGAYFGPAKRWLTDRYAELADLLIEKQNAEILIFGSSGEQKLASEISSLMKFKPKVLTGRTTLRELIGLIKTCDLFITNDSGPMHLAAGLEVPQIALFGSTDETATGPFSPKATVIKHSVFCSPCLLRECPIDFRCFNSISVREVYLAAVEKLSTDGGIRRKESNRPEVEGARS